MKPEDIIISYVLKEKEAIPYVKEVIEFLPEKVIEIINFIEQNGNDEYNLSLALNLDINKLIQLKKENIEEKVFLNSLRKIQVEAFKNQVSFEIAKELSSIKTDKDLQNTLEKFKKYITIYEKTTNISTSKKSEDTFILAKDFEKVFKKINKEIDEEKRRFGFNNLDSLLTRPLEPEEITTIVGQKGTGKSIFLKNVEINLIEQNIPVFSFNLEMSLRSNLSRLLAIKSGINYKKLLNLFFMLEEDEKKALNEALEWFKDKPYIYVGKEGLSLYDIFNIYSTSYEKIKKDYKKPPVIIIDSLDMVEGFISPAYIKEQMEILHTLCRKHKVHVIGTVQANESFFRGSSIRTPKDLDFIRFTKFDIYGSSYYAARSRLVLFIHRPLILKKEYFGENLFEELNAEPDIMKVKIVKQNDGELGVCNLLFNNSNLRLSEYEEVSKNKELEESFINHFNGFLDETI